MTWIPSVPDRSPQTEEFLPVVIRDDVEVGGRDPVDVCSTLEAARELGAVMARNVGGDARFIVLRRRVGVWEEA